MTALYSVNFRERTLGSKNKEAQRGRWAISLFFTYYFQYTKRTITHLLSILRLQVAGLMGVGGICTVLGA
jgi:hypothetical protein